MSFEGFGILLQQGIDETEKLHDSFVLTQVLVTLEQEIVIDAIAPNNFELARTLLLREHIERRTETGDPDNLLAGRVCTCKTKASDFDQSERERRFYSPGNARSRSFAASNLGETYCSSSKVSVGRFLLILRNTCESVMSGSSVLSI